MRRIVVLAVLCGCASAGSPSEETTPRQATIYAGADAPLLLAEKPRAVMATIAAPPATVWLATKKVYGELDVPVNVENTGTRQLGNANFYKTREFGGQPMAGLVDCGSGMTGPKASSYRIYMSLLTTVQADGKGGTTIQTTFVPTGQDLSGNSSDRLPCGTTGRVEAMLIERVKAIIGK
ncbi:MAG TPA: hypothetical protein VK636_03870 [Gemmatimonadaceae bacterium]|nr:hypothetical protein [Gemmatimonadaceae bacterium]